MEKLKLMKFGFIFIYFFIVTAAPVQTVAERLTGKVVRPAAVAGLFYPGSPDQLRETINTLIGNVPDIKPSGKILAALAPHAGYAYSGKVAAYTHKNLSQVHFDTLVIVGHDTFQSGVAYVSPADFFQTPLGKMPVDREMIKKMQAFDPGIKTDGRLHAREHTIEVHLPFVQVQNKQCKIIPILFGNPTVNNCRILADAILAAAGKKTVLVLASTDMSHYPDYESACKVDTSTLKLIEELDVEKFLNHLEKHKAHAVAPNLRTALCAGGGVGTALLFAKAHGANHARVLKYANSGDIPGGDKGRVVGYCSVLILKQ